jgi:hypothetical protein
MLVFDRILTAEEANNIGGYLAEKYGMDVTGTPYDGQGLGTSMPLLNTTIVATANSTLAVVTEPGQPVVLNDVEVADNVTLSIGNEPNVQITNLTLGTGSVVNSSLAAPGGTSNGTITVNGRLTGDNGNASIGDLDGGDWYFTNLTLGGSSTYEWTFTSAAEIDVAGDGTMVATEDSLTVFGGVNLQDGVTIQLVAGGGSSTTGVDVALFWAIDGATWDASKVTVLPPVDHPDWTWDTVDIGGVESPVLEYVFDEWVVLKGLVAPGDDQPGDANGDDKVDYADVIAFNAQLGQRGADLSCDWFADGKIDLLDFQILKDNMGFGTGGGAPEPPASETPEPTTMILLAGGLPLLLKRRRRGLTAWSSKERKSR